MTTEAPRPPASGVGLSPSQRRTLEALRRSGEPLVFDAGLVDDLVAEVTEALDHFADRVDGDELVVTKHRLGSVLDCETHHLVRSEFEWTAANAKGTVAHRAIQLLLSWRGEPTPEHLVDEAMTRLVEEERGIGTWLGRLTDADLADLRGQSTVRVTQFLEHFPPLSARWHPVTEASVRWPVDGPVMLFGKVDLAFGRPAGDESRKVIIDLKTGRPSPRHRQDLGYYALLETLTRRVPPRKVATFYLDAGEPQAEEVNERVLRSAVRRTLDGVHALVELEVEGRDPTTRPGHTCRWCPLAVECEPGRRWLGSTATE